MGEIVIKLNDERLIKKITDRARAHNRSPDWEAAKILGDVLLETSDKRERARLASGIAAMTPSGRTQTDSSALVREDRDR